MQRTCIIHKSGSGGATQVLGQVFSIHVLKQRGREVAAAHLIQDQSNHCLPFERSLQVILVSTNASIWTLESEVTDVTLWL